MKKKILAGVAVAVAFSFGELVVACSSSSSVPQSSSGADGSTISNDGGTTPDTGILSGDSGSGDTGASPPVDSGPAALINGCTSFTDNTASGVASLNWGFGIMSDVNHCSKIAVGQSVTWTGDFATHPLGPHDDTQPGGTATNGDPITSGASPGSSVTITFPTAGTYGYWCLVHQTMMMGAIQVQ